LRLSTGCSDLGEFINGQDFITKNFASQSLRDGGRGNASSVGYDDNNEAATSRNPPLLDI
jgi:hypothetical protein